MGEVVDAREDLHNGNASWNFESDLLPRHIWKIYLFYSIFLCITQNGVCYLENIKFVCIYAK